MAKKRSQKNVVPVADVLQALLGNGKSPLSDQFLRWRLWRFWPDVVGATIGKSCEPVGYKYGNLTLWVRSSPRLQEMRFLHNNIRDKVNQYVGREWVKYVTFTLDRRSVPDADRPPEGLDKVLE